MVCYYGRLVAGTFEIVMPVTVHAFDNGEHFFIVDLVVSMGIVELFADERTRIPDTVISHLGNRATKCFVRGVSLDYGRLGAVEVLKD